MSRTEAAAHKGAVAPAGIYRAGGPGRRRAAGRNRANLTVSGRVAAAAGSGWRRLGLALGGGVLHWLGIALATDNTAGKTGYQQTVARQPARHVKCNGKSDKNMTGVIWQVAKGHPPPPQKKTGSYGITFLTCFSPPKRFGLNNFDIGSDIAVNKRMNNYAIDTIYPN